jgi:hypothetical protein
VSTHEEKYELPDLLTLTNHVLNKLTKLDTSDWHVDSVATVYKGHSGGLTSPRQSRLITLLNLHSGETYYITVSKDNW